MWYAYLIPPALGAVIGYFTNVVAIRMLFHPHEPKYIFGWQIPFTPGLIPKEKGRVAASIGEAISENLMNKEILEQNLLSDEMIAKIEQGIDSFCKKQLDNKQTVREFAGRFIPEDEINRLADCAVGDFSELIGKKIAETDLSTDIARQVVAYVMKKMSGNMLGGIAEMMAKPAEEFLAKHLKEIMGQYSGDIVKKMVGNQVSGFLDTQMSNLFKDKEERIESVKNTVVSAYKSLIREHLPHILGAVDIRKIIEERIKEMDVKETERLILQVMNKELRAIEWFGALLGGVIGLFNIFLL